jgi:hypothetical protein
MPPTLCHLGICILEACCQYQQKIHIYNSPLLKKKTVCSCKGTSSCHGVVKEKLAVEERPKRSKDGNGMYCSTTHSELGVAATSLWS